MIAITGVFAATIKMVGGALASWAEARIAGDVGSGVRLAVLDDVLSLNLNGASPRHSDHGSAQVARSGRPAERMAALTMHVHEIERGVAQGVLLELRALVQLLPIGALLVVLAPKLAASAVVALGGFGMLAFTLRRAFKRAHARASAQAEVLVEAADEAVRHAELWATYGAKRRIRAHVVRVGRAMSRESARIRLRASLLSSTSEVLGALALVVALVLASRGILGVERGMVVPFAIAFFMAYRPLRDLVDARLTRARGEASLQAVGVTVDERRVPQPMPSSRSWELAPLVMEGVRTMHGRHGALSFAAAPGSIVAIVGPTGIGKTSLIRALLGLDPLAAGAVRYGSTQIDRGEVGPSERPFAWVPQDAPVVGDTLAINVGLGRADDDAPIPDPTPVLATLGAEQLVTTLGDDALATVRSLSGGERQWIAVARAIATGLPVLLLDEPTSALDDASQARLLEAIARLRGKRTVILVTHRPEPLAIAEVVVRLESLDSSADGEAKRAHVPDGLRA